MKARNPCSLCGLKRRVRGVLLLGSFIALLGCGARADLDTGGTVAVDAVAPITSLDVKLDDVAPPTTAIVADTFTIPPTTTVGTPVASDASVLALAAVLGVEGELEQRDGEHGVGQCIGSLEPRGLCVNVPLWGVWQYWDLNAQDSPGASDDQARSVAGDLFAQLGVDPGSVISITPNGPLPQVEFSSGALVMVAEDGRIAMIIAGTALLPTG